MPFKSKAQRRKFAELLVKGEISPEVYEEWNRETGRAELPERVKPKPKKKRGSKKKSATRKARTKAAAPSRKRRKAGVRRTSAKGRSPTRKKRTG
jgi:hypothetical protein